MYCPDHMYKDIFSEYVLSNWSKLDNINNFGWTKLAIGCIHVTSQHSNYLIVQDWGGGAGKNFEEIVKMQISSFLIRVGWFALGINEL